MHTPPLRLVLALEMFEDEEVYAAVRCAVERGVEWVEDGEVEGLVGVVVGPRA